MAEKPERWGGDAMAEVYGVQRWLVRSLKAYSALATLAAGGFAAAWAHEVRTEPVAVPYVVVLDERTNGLFVAAARPFAPQLGNYEDIARRAIYELRAWPADGPSLERSKAEARRIIDPVLAPQFFRMLEDQRKSAGRHGGIEVSGLRTTPLGEGDGHAWFRAEWLERKYGPNGAGPWEKLGAELRVSYKPTTDATRLATNLTQLWVDSARFWADGRVEVSEATP